MEGGIDEHDTNDKLVGVYSSAAEAEAAKQRKLQFEGFRDYPDCFFVSQYEVDKDAWSEGFTSDDLIRLDYEGCDKAYIHEALTAFLEKAANYGRALIEIRMSRMMLDRLQIERGRNGAFFKGVPVRVCNTGFDETVEMIFGLMPGQH